MLCFCGAWFSVLLLQIDCFAAAVALPPLFHFSLVSPAAAPPGDALAYIEDLDDLKAGNAVRLLRNGNQAFPIWLDAIDAARTRVSMEMYIFDDDRMGRSIRRCRVLCRSSRRLGSPALRLHRVPSRQQYVMFYVASTPMPPPPPTTPGQAMLPRRWPPPRRCRTRRRCPPGHPYPSPRQWPPRQWPAIVAHVQRHVSVTPKPPCYHLAMVMLLCTTQLLCYVHLLVGSITWFGCICSTSSSRRR